MRVVWIYDSSSNDLYIKHKQFTPFTVNIYLQNVIKDVTLNAF